MMVIKSLRLQVREYVGWVCGNKSTDEAFELLTQLPMLCISGVTRFVARNFGRESVYFDVLVGEFCGEFYQAPVIKENIYLAL